MLLIGSIDALMVSFLVAVIVFYFLRHTDKLEQGRELLQREIENRIVLEEALKESEVRYRKLFENAGDAIFILEAEGPETGRIVDANQSAAGMHGYTLEELLELNIKDLDTPSAAAEAPARIGRMLQGEWIKAEIFHRKKDGTLFPVEISAGLLEVGRHKYFLAFDRDIRQRKETEAALLESEALHRRLIEAAPYSITVTRMADGRYVQVNDSFTRISGYSSQEALGRTPFDLGLFVDPGDRERFLQIIEEKGEIDEFQLQYRTKGGRVMDVLLSARPLRVGGEDCLLAVALDITDKRRAQREREELEKQLRQAQKMEAIGTLAGGIAHDFNNILMALLGYTEMVLMDISPETAIYNDLKKVSQAGHRAKDLVGQILAFTRRSEPELKPVEICSLVKEALKLIRAVLPSSVEIRLNIYEETALVVANATQMHQVIINLCTNGVQAMREKSGLLRVTLSKVQFHDQVPVVYSTIYPGTYIHLCVEDTGEGIKSDILDRIFDPYFTTKEMGEGTGMGLSTVLGIIKGHGGAITVETTLGRGSRFNVFLPLSEKEDGRTEEKVPDSFPQGRGRILLVDDEETLVELGKKMLEQLGYSVAIRNNGQEALETFKRNPQAFDLIITDQTMPKMLGTTLTNRIREIRSDMPIILCTGYSDLVTENTAGEFGIDAFLKKPFNLRELGKTVESALSGITRIQRPSIH